MIRNTSLRALLTRWCLAAWVVTQIGVGLGVFGLVDHFFGRAEEQQQLRAVTSLYRRRPLFMQPDYTLCPPPARYELPPSRHLSRPLEFNEWGPLFAQAVAVTSDSVVRLYGSKGELLYSSGPLDEVPELTEPEVGELMKIDHGNSTRELVGRSERYHILLFPIVAEYHHFTHGVLQIIKSSRSDDEKLRTLAYYVVLSCSLAFLIGYLILLRIADALARPLGRLMETSRRVGEGDLDARTGLPCGRNEVFALGAVFDRMAGQLQTSFLAQSRFVADASHELKTPLTTVGGMAEVLEMAENDPVRRKAVKTIGREVDRMNALICDLLTLSQADEAPEAERLPVVLHDVLEELVDTASMQGRTVVCECPVALVVAGPERRLRRIFRNLIDNALQYSPDEGSVSVRVRLTPTSRVFAPRVQVEVADSGPGISPDALAHIFERFYREDRSRNRRTGGTGLGLAIVQALVQSLDGDVRVESTLGQGTRFYVTLPAL